MTGDEIKPCPCCGGLPRIEERQADSYGRVYYAIECPRCPVEWFADSRAHVIEYWNKGQSYADSLRNRIAELEKQVQSYRDNPSKAFSEMGCHDVEEYYRDPCTDGHDVTWIAGSAGDAPPKQLPCNRCHQMVDLSDVTWSWCVRDRGRAVMP